MLYLCRFTPDGCKHKAFQKPDGQCIRNHEQLCAERFGKSLPIDDAPVPDVIDLLSLPLVQQPQQQIEQVAAATPVVVVPETLPELYYQLAPRAAIDVEMMVAQYQLFHPTRTHVLLDAVTRLMASVHQSFEEQKAHEQQYVHKLEQAQAEVELLWDKARACLA